MNPPGSDGKCSTAQLRTRNNRTTLHLSTRMLGQATRNVRAPCFRLSANAMERLIQWIDDLDDLVGVIGLARERIRAIVLAFIFAVASLTFQVAGILLALSHPPLALATAILMFVTLLYRSVTTPLEIA